MLLKRKKRSDERGKDLLGVCSRGVLNWYLISKVPILRPVLSGKLPSIVMLHSRFSIGIVGPLDRFLCCFWEYFKSTGFFSSL